jgi:ATP-dependent Clp protease ATP-binding subunit ClpC
MSYGESDKYEAYFSDPRFGMTIAGRILIRVVSYIFYLTLIAAAGVFLISDIHRLRSLGLFLCFFLADRLAHRGEADIPFKEIPAGEKINLTNVIQPQAFSVIERAFDRSLITKEDLYLEIARQLLGYPQIQEGLRRLDVKPEEFRQKVEDLLSESKDKASGTAENYSKSAGALVMAAFPEALSAGHDFIEIADVFSGLSKMESGPITRLFSIFSIEAGDLERALILSSTRRGMFSRLPTVLGGFTVESHRYIKHRIMNRAWTSRPTPELDKYSTDFTDLAREGRTGFLIGHAAEYERMVETLARPVNPNVLLVGEAGIGKETLVQHLADRLSKDDVPRALFDKRLVSLELQNLVAGAPPEELNARIRRIVEEIYMAGNVILYIPDIHNLVKTSGTAYLSAADALMPIIMSNSFPVVGSTYPKEYKQLIEPRSDFAGAFEAVPVNEITEAEAEVILSYESLILEKGTHITISFAAIKRAVTLAKKYFRSKFLPSSAEELLKGALVDAERRGERTLGPDRVTAIAEAKVNIPLHEAAGEEAEQLLHMEDIIHERLVDQEEAVKAVSQALREYRSGLSRQGGPIASFLFVGPTGVGKTELAKILAKIQFGSEKMMVRFDMTEYQDKQSFFRFIGSPDGQTRGALTDAVLAKPYCLILLDEFEKAFPDILNLFLQVFDDGRLTDNLSRTVDFSNTVIIATSNAHSDIINDSLSKGESMTDIAEYLKKRLVDVFKPELLNRFSKIIVFKNLEPDELVKIVKLNLDELAGTIKGQGMVLEYDDTVLKKLVQLGYDPAFGARPLRRVIDEKLRAPLSEAILAKKIGRGSKVKIVLNGENFDFTEGVL